MPETECREGFPIFRDLVGIATDDGTLLPSSPVSARFRCTGYQARLMFLAGWLFHSIRLAAALGLAR
jgi:hypothetical protein